jgi:hypothetical protein
VVLQDATLRKHATPLDVLCDGDTYSSIVVFGWRFAVDPLTNLPVMVDRCPPPFEPTVCVTVVRGRRATVPFETKRPVIADFRTDLATADLQSA